MRHPQDPNPEIGDQQISGNPAGGFTGQNEKTPGLPETAENPSLSLPQLTVLTPAFIPMLSE